MPADFLWFDRLAVLWVSNNILLLASVYGLHREKITNFIGVSLSLSLSLWQRQLKLVESRAVLFVCVCVVFLARVVLSSGGWVGISGALVHC